MKRIIKSKINKIYDELLYDPIKTKQSRIRSYAKNNLSHTIRVSEMVIEEITFVISSYIFFYKQKINYI